MLDIWEKCYTKSHITTIRTSALRAVENQSYIATRQLVDNDQEQMLLEELLDNSKPNYPSGDEFHGLHYLLSTPFRYPPLDYGSRFGDVYERGIFYASLTHQTLFSEIAYYRFRFMHDTTAKLGATIIPYTCFEIDIATSRALNLTHAPFDRYKEHLSNPEHYHHSKAFGSKLRHENIELCLFYSARCTENGTNLAIFSPIVFKERSILHSHMHDWSCYTDSESISFIHRGKAQRFYYPIQQFMINDTFPIAA